VTNVADILGPILEVMTWVGFVVGLPLLAWGWISATEAHGLVVGSDVVLFYDVCHPSRWGLTPPKRDHAAWIVGWIFTAVGALATVGGVVLLLF
jgi:hypothetical protein